jgi:hypothetical protein
MSTSWPLLLLACGLTSAWLAQHKGYSARVWFWLGALFGVVALAVLARQPRRMVLPAGGASGRLDSPLLRSRAEEPRASTARGRVARCDSPHRQDDATHR